MTSRGAPPESGVRVRRLNLGLPGDNGDVICKEIPLDGRWTAEADQLVQIVGERDSQ
jgi:hypothetical protein